MSKNEKKKENRLEKPTLFCRTWKTWIYTLFWLIGFTLLFWLNFTLDDVAFELDYFLMYGLKDFRIELLYTAVAFWFWFRSCFKFFNLIKFTYLSAQHEVDVVENGGSKRLYEAVEGTGKTLNLANDLLLLACDQDYKMRLKYYLKYPFREELKDDPDFNVLKDSFEYFEKDLEHIPHLMANFYFEYNNQKAYPFSIDYTYFLS